MRLTDDILRASDNAAIEFTSRALLLAAAGRFGLIPGAKPFAIALGIHQEFVEVEALDCLAVTKGGHLIDISYDTKYSGHLQTHLPLPEDKSEKEVFLTISQVEGQWEETLDGFEEPVYEFGWVKADKPIAENALPIARLVNSEYGGWHTDDIDFVPPCLFVSAHPKFEALRNRFAEALSATNEKARPLIHSEAEKAIRLFWPNLQQIMIAIDKDRDLMTPMELLKYVQQYVCIFTTACELDDYLSLADAEAYYHYAFAPYNYQKVYQRIKEGIAISFSINDKMDLIEPETHEPEPKAKRTETPYIHESQLYQNCRTRTVKIPVVNPSPEAVVLYSLDGSEPSNRLSPNAPLVIENGFNKKKVEEPDKTITVKLKAVADGVSSEISTYTVTLHKDYVSWDGYVI